MRANITLAVDEKTVEKARLVARQQGTSLNALIREYIERLAGSSSGEATMKELRQLWAEGRGNSRGTKIRREDAYEERLGRPRVR
jgi:hypothetical protein